MRPWGSTLSSAPIVGRTKLRTGVSLSITVERSQPPPPSVPRDDMVKGPFGWVQNATRRTAGIATAEACMHPWQPFFVLPTASAAFSASSPPAWSGLKRARRYRATNKGRLPRGIKKGLKPIPQFWCDLRRGGGRRVVVSGGCLGLRQRSRGCGLWRVATQGKIYPWTSNVPVWFGRGGSSRDVGTQICPRALCPLSLCWTGESERAVVMLLVTVAPLHNPPTSLTSPAPTSLTLQRTERVLRLSPPLPSLDRICALGLVVAGKHPRTHHGELIGKEGDVAVPFAQGQRGRHGR